MTCGQAKDSVNLLLFSIADRVDENHIVVRDKRLTHIQEVLRAKPGQQLRVGEIGGLVGQGSINSLTSEEVVLEIELDQQPPKKIPVTLYLALPRPKVLRRVLRSVAEFGVANLHLINSYRVEKSYWQTPALAPDRVEHYFLEGLSQARDTVLPQLHCHTRFKPFVEDTLPALLHGQKALLAHPVVPADHKALESFDRHTPTSLFVGPEGGFIEYEVSRLLESGCETISLGNRVLRVENALGALLGRWS